MGEELPPLNENGDLPAGIHRISSGQLATRFASGNPVRQRAFARLMHVRDLAVRTGKLRNFYIFGSFVTAAAEPRDIDIVLIMASEFQLEHCSRESRTLFQHADAQARYGASIFWLREGMLSESEMREFLETWQIKRDGTKRGIVELI